MTAKKQRLKYLIFDLFAAAASWTAFYLYRKELVEPLKFGYDIPLELNSRYFLGVGLIPLFWIFLYYLSGYYKDVFRKSRLNELGQTLLMTLIGTLIIFFTLMLNDVVVSHRSYYGHFLVLFTCHFIFTYIPRLLITSSTIRQFRKGILNFRTLIIGGNKRAMEIYQEMRGQKPSLGYQIVGFVTVNGGENKKLEKYVPKLGNMKSLTQVIEKHRIQEVIIAIESSEHKAISRIINKLNESRVVIKAIPDMYDILTGKVKIENIYGTPLIQISHNLMPYWQEKLKRFIDIGVSLLALTILLPLSIFLLLGVLFSSKGPVFFKQERVGRYGKPFFLYKFRSMFRDAETRGPELARNNDDRLTGFGKFMRKRKLDEIPNFWNVLKGDMSLVGPRPERYYYVKQIMRKAPHYTHLHKVKPGITSWGQVKYGYAENVDEMVKRLKYDIIYIENMSIFVDFQIMINTLVTVIRGKGI